MPKGFLNGNDHSRLYKNVKNVKDYFTLGLNLGIQYHELEKIEADNTSTRRRLQQLCAVYIRSNPRASWSHVVKALREMNENRLADNIENTFLSKKQGYTSESGSVDSVPTSGIRRSSSSGYKTVPASDSAEDMENAASPSAPLVPSSFSSGCSCGKCSVYAMCTKGCSRPNHGVQLPVLSASTKELSSVEQFRCESQMESETKKISVIFAGLVSDTCDSMEETTTVGKVQVWLKQLEGCYNVAKCHSSLPTTLLAECMDDVMNADSMQKLFLILSDYWSWYNHSLLEKLIEKFGTDGDQRGLQQFKEEFANYSRHRLCELSQDKVSFGVRGGKGKVPMLLKVDKNWEEIHISQLSAIQHSVSSILGARYQAFYLASVCRGCILLKFIVPTSILEAVFPLSVSQKKALKEAEVMMLTCGHYTYRFSPTTAFHKSESTSPADQMFKPSEHLAGEYVLHNESESDPGLVTVESLVSEDGPHSPTGDDGCDSHSEGYNGDLSEVCPVDSDGEAPEVEVMDKPAQYIPQTQYLAPPSVLSDKDSGIFSPCSSRSLYCSSCNSPNDSPITCSTASRFTHYVSVRGLAEVHIAERIPAERTNLVCTSETSCYYPSVIQTPNANPWKHIPSYSDAFACPLPKADSPLHTIHTIDNSIGNSTINFHAPTMESSGGNKCILAAEFVPECYYISNSLSVPLPSSSLSVPLPSSSLSVPLPSSSLSVPLPSSSLSVPLPSSSLSVPLPSSSLSVLLPSSSKLRVRKSPKRPPRRAIHVDDTDIKDIPTSAQLWEFLLRVIKKPKYSYMISWENQKEGLFRFHDAQAFAALWGKHRNRPNMTYDKVARALRYYYKRDILNQVGGRFTYRFSKRLSKLYMSNE